MGEALVCDKCGKRLTVVALYPVLVNQRHCVLSKTKRPVTCDGILRRAGNEVSG